MTDGICGGYNNAGAPAEKDRQILVSLEQLSNLVGSFNEAVHELAKRLEPVMLPTVVEPTGSGGSQNSIPIASPIARRVHEMRVHLGDVAQELREILNRLEV